LAAEIWTPTVYRELRRLADGLMAGERDGHTLDATSLAHEAWLRLRHSRNAGDVGRGALLGIASQAMRRILTDHARRRASDKRGGSARRTTLHGKDAVGSDPAAFVLDLDTALTELTDLDPDLARVVELRFYGGLDVAETAAALDVSARTVKRRWRFARAWLRRRLPEDT
jgi:RNA polymerase sigma factor (TIGR02999 family)